MKTRLGIVCAFAAAGAFADGLGVEVTRVWQNPSSRVVEVDYTLSGGPAVVTFDVKVGGESIGDAHTTYAVGDINKLVQADTHTFYWNSGKAWPNHVVEDAEICVNAWDVSNPPDYMVIWPGSGNITYHTSAENLPDGGLANKVYKTERIVMRKIPAGGKTVQLGSAAGSDQNRLHYVSFSEDFYIGVYELTVGQWEREGFSSADMQSRNAVFPANKVSIEQFAYASNAMDLGEGTFIDAIRKRTGIAFDMPTDAQWEFACKGDTAGGRAEWNDGSATCGSDADVVDENLENLGWYNKNSGNALHEVGLKNPSNWGLYDMHGNISENCKDVWFSSLPASVDNSVDPLCTEAYGTPTAPGGSNSYNGGRVMRGGNIRGTVRKAFTAARTWAGNNEKSDQQGFRLACPAEAK